MHLKSLFLGFLIIGCLSLFKGKVEHIPHIQADITLTNEGSGFFILLHLCSIHGQVLVLRANDAKMISCEEYVYLGRSFLGLRL